MNKVLAVLASVTLFAAADARAASFLKLPESGNYVLRCQATDFVAGSLTGTSELAFYRVDDSPEVELFRAPMDENGRVTATLTIAVTPGNDAEIGCYAFDRSGNKSERSVDTAVLDFTPPPAPTLE